MLRYSSKLLVRILLPHRNFASDIYKNNIRLNRKAQLNIILSALLFKAPGKLPKASLGKFYNKNLVMSITKITEEPRLLGKNPR